MGLKRVTGIQGQILQGRTCDSDCRQGRVVWNGILDKKDAIPCDRSRGRYIKKFIEGLFQLC